MKSAIMAIIIILGAGAGFSYGEELLPEKRKPGPVELGMSGAASFEDSEFNATLAASGRWKIWRGLLVRYGLAFEEKHNSFFKVWNSFGAGYEFTFNKASVPLYCGGGLTTTGLWKHILNRPFGSIGAGVRYAILPHVGIGLNVEVAAFSEGIFEEHLLFGFFITPGPRD
ncbi:MAG: hypothetical protein GF401_18615 [Chitinivibrionales bacterium]|nr:hypothetical protein [Chitinivibrionales bacterium]